MGESRRRVRRVIEAKAALLGERIPAAGRYVRRDARAGSKLYPQAGREVRVATSRVALGLSDVISRRPLARKCTSAESANDRRIRNR
jgi:hypothetical protein